MVFHNLKGPLAFANPTNNLSPRLDTSVLPVRISDLSFTFLLKCCSNGLWIQETFDSSPVHLICVISFVCGSDDFIAPALLCVSPQIACRFCIPFVKKSPDTLRLM